MSLGSTTTIEYYREAGKITLSEDDIIAILQDKGCTDISVEDVSGTAKWTYTKPNGGTVKNATVTATQVYVVNLKLDADVQALVDAKTISVEIAEGSEYVAAKGQVKIVLTHNTSTFGSTFNANSTDGSKVPVTASGIGDATGNKTRPSQQQCRRNCHRYHRDRFQVKNYLKTVAPPGSLEPGGIFTSRPDFQGRTSIDRVCGRC